MTYPPPAFLATTALKEYWDRSDSMIFLAEWCRLFGESNTPGLSAVPSLPCPWERRGAVEEGFAYVDSTYEWLLPLLSARLNAIHGTGYSQRYWRIVAGPWLVYFLHAAYDRYRRIKSALVAYPDLTSLGLSETSYRIPLDMLDFLDLAKGDPYNLQLITMIMELMGHPSPRKAWKDRQEPAKPVSKRKASGPRRLVLAALRFVIQPFASVFLRNAYFPTFKDELRVMAKTRGRAIVIYAPLADLAGINADPVMRARLMGLTDPGEKDEFRRVAAGLISGGIPISLLEGWNRVGDFKRRYYAGKPKAVFSTNAYHFDEAFKRFAGEAADDGATICGGQHGGNYGSFRNMPIHGLEYKLADRFYSWGWKAPESEGRIIPFPATKLTGRKPLEADNSRDGVLFVTTATPRFPFLYQFSEYQHLQYIEWQLRFLKLACPGKGKSLRVRPHIEDGGWGYEKRWRAAFPDLAVETWAVPFLDSLRDCRVYVSDHLETTFIEALAAGKPSLLFINPEHYALREEAKPFYDALLDSGILHHSPESCAAALEEAYADVESWWNAPTRREARRLFCSNFALTAEDGLERWAAELTMLSKSGSPAGR